MKVYLKISSNNLIRYNLWIGSVVMLLSMIACSGNSNIPGKGDVLVRFGKETLLREEVDFFMPDTLAGEDSANFAGKYIEEWISNQAVAEQALRDVEGLENGVKYKVSAYENKLIEFEFMKWLIQEKQSMLVVSDAEIRNYYKKFPDKFISREPYYQFFYIKTSLERQYQLTNDLKTTDAEKISELITWAEENAIEFRLDSSYVTDPEIERISKGYYFGNIRRASRNTVYPYAHKEEDTQYYDFFPAAGSNRTGRSVAAEYLSGPHH